MLKQASIAQEQYNRDIMLPSIRGVLPVKETTFKLLARDIHMDPASCECFGVLLKSLRGPEKGAGPVSFTDLRASALSLVREHSASFRALLITPAPEELLVIFFFLPDKYPLVEKHCAVFLQTAFEYSDVLGGGVSAKYSAREGFPKVYAECCAALAALTEKDPQARLLRYDQLFTHPYPPDISQDAFSNLVFDACANAQREKLRSICFQMLLQLCHSGRLYRLFDSYMVMISGIRHVLEKL
jgi:hypothetical protein